MENLTAVPAPEANGESVPQQTQNSTDAVAASYEKRLRDMQAMKDRAEARLQEVQPIIEQLRSRPDVIEVLRQPPRVHSSAMPVGDPTAPPAKPEPPDGYDEHAAINEPGSESWRYRKAVEKWRDAIAEWQIGQVQQSRQEMLQRQKMAAEREATMRAMAEIKTQVQTKMGWSEDKAVDFVRFMSNDENFRDLDRMIVVYNALQAHLNGGKAPFHPIAPANLGPTPAGGGSAAPSPASEDESKGFNEGLLAHRTQRLRVSGNR